MNSLHAHLHTMHTHAQSYIIYKPYKYSHTHTIQTHAHPITHIYSEHPHTQWETR